MSEHEQELNEFADRYHPDYDVQISGSVYPYVRIVYKDKLISDQGFMVGFMRWPRIRRFIRKTIEGHQKLVRDGFVQ